MLADALVDVGGHERRDGGEVRRQEAHEVALVGLALAPSLLDLGGLLEDRHRSERWGEAERPRGRVLDLLEEELRRDPDGLALRRHAGQAAAKATTTPPST